MRLIKLFIAFLILASQNVLLAEIQPIEMGSELMLRREERVKELCGRPLKTVQRLLDSYFQDQTHDASCRARLAYLEGVLECAAHDEVRRWIISEFRAHWDHLHYKQQYYFITYRGREFFAINRLDSALYFTDQARLMALANRDTNRYIMALNNISAMFSEVRWYHEALKASMTSLAMARAIGDTASIFYPYIVNNLQSSFLDMGYAARARGNQAYYSAVVRRLGNEELVELHALNSFRLNCISAEDEAERTWRSVLLEGDLVAKTKYSAFFAKSLQARRGPLASEVMQVLINLLADTKVPPYLKINFLVPALLEFEEVPPRAKSLLLPLEEEVLGAGDVFAERDYYELMSVIFNSNDYWEKYRKAVDRVDSASGAYTMMFSNILQQLSWEAQVEELQQTQGRKMILVGQSLIFGAAVFMLLLLVAIWYLWRVKRKGDAARATFEEERKRLEEYALNYDVLLGHLVKWTSMRGRQISKQEIERVVEAQVGNPIGQNRQILRWMDEFGLTKTEAEVLARIALGFENAEILSDLNLSKAYVHNVRTRLRQKLPLPDGQSLDQFARSMTSVPPIPGISSTKPSTI